MSESPAMSRNLGGAEPFERRMHLGGQLPVQESPLAELARLVGQEDPFRTRVPDRAPVRPEDAGTSVAPLGERPHWSAPDRHAATRPDLSERDRDFDDAFTAPDEPGLPDEAAVVHGSIGQPPVLPPRAAAPSLPVRNGRAPEPSADAWAQGHTGEAYRGDDLVAHREGPVRGAGASSSRRTLVVLAAVVALTGGGLAASFMARPSQGVAASPNTTAPTILAATGPSKVQPEVTPTDADAPSQSSTLLDKNKSDGTATAKVVDSVEQPVDLAKAVQPSAAAVDDARVVSPSGFPEPRKVRTVTVRPDGTIVATAAAPVAGADPVSAALGQPSDLAFDPKMSVPSPMPDQPAVTPAQTPAAAPVTQKSRVRAATTPVAADSSTSGSIPTDSQAVSPAAKVKVAKAKPVAVATAETPTAADTAAAPGGSGGGYAVQLGAPPTEAEAQDVSARLSKKFAAQFGSYRPAIHKADVGAKSVYRIRIGNLSQDDAKSLCTSLKGAGGGCFVVHN